MGEKHILRKGKPAPEGPLWGGGKANGAELKKRKIALLKAKKKRNVQLERRGATNRFGKWKRNWGPGLLEEGCLNPHREKSCASGGEEGIGPQKRKVRLALKEEA